MNEMTRSIDHLTVPILLWHAVSDTDDGDPWRVSVAAFREQLDLVVAMGRTPLTATEYGAVLRGERALPAAPVVLTMDDGYRDVLDEIVPSLQARALTATVFVTSGFLGRPGMLDVEALRALGEPQAAAHLEIGAHSVSHPHLDVIPAADALAEIRDCRHHLEDVIGRPVLSFAYPHGSHHRRVRQQVVASGYTSAYAVKNAWSHPQDDVFAISRFTVMNDTPLAMLEGFLDGSRGRIAPARERWQTTVFREVRRARWLAQSRRS